VQLEKDPHAQGTLIAIALSADGVHLCQEFQLPAAVDAGCGHASRRSPHTAGKCAPVLPPLPEGETRLLPAAPGPMTSDPAPGVHRCGKLKFLDKGAPRRRKGSMAIEGALRMRVLSSSPNISRQSSLVPLYLSRGPATHESAQRLQGVASTTMRRGSPAEHGIYGCIL